MAALKKPLSAHSDTSASSMDRWGPDGCPGSVKLCKTMPNQTSAYAEEGTRAHALAEQRLKLGQWPKNLPDYPQEMVDAVSVYVDYIDKKMKKLSGHPKSRRLLEHKFHVPKLHEGFRGTSDALIYDGELEHLDVIDYKHGAGVPVSPEENLQLMYYGIGAMMTLGSPVKSVTLTIIQPRYSTEEAIKSWDIDPETLREFSVVVLDAIKATEDPKAPLVTGDHCRWCSAKPICPTLRKEAEIAMKEEFALAALPKLDQDTLGELLSKLETVEDWAKGVREFAYQQAKLGQAPTGYKLVPKIARRQWVDPIMAAKKFETAINSSIVRDLMTDPELKSPAQVEKILGKSQKELIDSLTVSISSGDTLVPETDKRQAVDKKQLARQMFGD